MPLVKFMRLCYNTEQGGGMMKNLHRRCWAAGVLLAVAAAAAVLFLLRLSRPDGAQRAAYLGCTDSDSGGWTFFTETGAAEPVFGFGGFFDGIPAAEAGPVAAERTMEEPGERRFLQFDCYDTGIQVFLDGELLYTDFPNEANRADRFLKNADSAGIIYDGLRIPLPEDCAGKRLRIVTYGPFSGGLRRVVFPSQVSRFSDAVVQTTGIVWTMAAATARLLLGLFLLLILAISAQEGDFLWKLLPLSGYFLLAAVAGICRTNLETSAGLNADEGVLNWIYRVYFDVLYGYLALELGGWKRRFLLCAALAHALLCALGSFGLLPQVSGAIGDWLGFAILLAALPLMLLCHEKATRRTGLCLCAIMAELAVVWGVTRWPGTNALYPLTNPVTALLSGYPHAFYTLLCSAAGIICAIQVVTGFARGMLLRQRQMQAMESNAQTAREKFEQAQAAVRQSAAFRHEWKNHIAALSLLAQKQDQAGIRDYLKRLDGELEQLSPRVYTANLTVNTILQRFAAQARKKGVAFRVHAILPEILQIREEDLCAFLFNLLDNALEAAAQTEHGDIFCSLQIRQQYLAIRCENTYRGALRTDSSGRLLTTKTDAADHGFGLMKMRSIAEKYGSVLDISYDENRFTVLTALRLRTEAEAL